MDYVRGSKSRQTMFRTSFLILVLCILGCSSPIPADIIITNGTIYTVNEAQPTAEAVVIKDGKIVYVGDKKGARAYKGEVLDLQGKTLVPGLVEGHAHLMGVGFNLLNIDLMATKGYEEIVDLVKKQAENTPKGQWILGRGWHQDKWVTQPERSFKNLPTHHLLSEAVPDHPVWLSHASGHMSLANAKAMELAGITAKTPQPAGGEFFLELGQPTGIFNETAELLIDKIVPAYSPEQMTRALELAIEACLKHGIVAFHDAGANQNVIDLYKKFAAEDKLKIRLFVMLSGSNEELLKSWFASGIETGLFDNHLFIRAVKLYGDGALGSRGAWLLEEYSDAPGVHGHEVTPMSEIKRIAADAHQAGFQVCTHAIGDRANKEVLDIYDEILQGNKDARFRIEHAQHMHPEDIVRFAQLGVIPAMQAIHMSSDRPWAIDRLGKQRIEEGAYMWQALLQSGAKIVNGTDAPVEPINPLASFYASVTRQTLNGTPEGGYEPAQKMTRAQALKSYTLDAAYGAFMEAFSGSIEAGKVADFTIFSKDIMTIPEHEILSAQVEMTIIDGKVVYKKE
jgi:predicted amidohydrolase YtcJ